MTFRRFIKLIREYPYLLNDTYVRSAEETREIFRAYAPTLSEAVARAKARADLPDEAWVYMETLAERIDRKNRRRERLTDCVGDILAQLRQYRRAVLVCAIIAIMVAYFTLIPSGKTIARNIYERVLTVVGRSLEIESPEYLGLAENVIQETGEEPFYETSSYASVSEYIDATNIVPFYIDDERFDCTGITEFNVSDDGRNVWINYRYKKSVVVTLRQEWLTNNESIAFGNTIHYKIMMIGDAEIHYLYDSEDNSFNGTTSLSDGSILHIYVSSKEHVEEVLSIIF